MHVPANAGVPGAWEAFQVGYDKPMSLRNLWPAEEKCPEFRHAPPLCNRHPSGDACACVIVGVNAYILLFIACPCAAGQER